MKKQKDDSIVITRVEEGVFSCVLVGKTPLVMNRMAGKAKRELLYPRTKSRADRAASIKHNPVAEYTDSVSTVTEGPTLLVIPGAAPKRAMASAALDMPGSARKAVIGRLTWIPDLWLSVYGKPFLFMAVVRMSDIKRTPDIRTRAILPRWAVPVTIRFAVPMLNPTQLLNLLNAAGFYVGIGDGRNEKGALNFGQFRVLGAAAAEKDKELQAIMKEDRKVQMRALAEPEPYDDESAELLTWYEAERKVRGRVAA